MSRTIFILSTATLLCFAACDKEKVTEPAAATSSTPVAPSAAAAPATAPAPAATAATAGAETIPVAADFEEEAEKSITKANYKTELSSLEAEIK
jgi:hypothetical protein